MQLPPNKSQTHKERRERQGDTEAEKSHPSPVCVVRERQPALEVTERLLPAPCSEIPMQVTRMQERNEPNHQSNHRRAPHHPQNLTHVDSTSVSEFKAFQLIRHRLRPVVAGKSVEEREPR